MKTFKNFERPTSLYQAEDSILFVGTEQGKIEVLSFETNEIVKVIDAH